MYNHQEIEQKWQDFWKKHNTFKTYNPDQSHAKPHPNPLLKEREQAPKFYVLDMFPYPSGAGLHVGHPEGYTANDIVARYKHARGYNVLHPMGWDAFGLPAENYAIKTGVHPRITTEQNIATFKRQIQSLGFSYDWSREIDTTDPKYFQWTQWIFLKLFEAGLAYEQDLPINYCPSCKTGLANEEVLSDFTCERCGTKVEKKKIRQWVLAITKYAERLLADVDDLDWPEGIKDMQRNWIGKSEGCEFEMKKVGTGENVFILHGRQSKDTTQTDGPQNIRHWFPWLKENLEKVGYEVYVPLIEKDWECSYENWKEQIEIYKDKIGEQTTLVGTSAGGAFWIRWLSENDISVKKLVLVAPAKYPDEKYHTEMLSHFYDFEESISSERIQDGVTIFVSNDEERHIKSAKYYTEKLAAKLIQLEDRGHFTTSYSQNNKKIPEVFEEITKSIRVYTTRVDTVFGMTYAVIAPDHPQVGDFITAENKEACESYIKTASQQSDQDRTADDKEKTGVFTGSYVINPYNGEQVPLWIADYVLGSYGTGAVMAVPAHDERDFAFAKKFGLEIKPVIAEKIGDRKNGAAKRLGVSAIIENSEGKILCQSQTYERGELFSLPGGGVEEGEDIIEGLMREITEETGYKDFQIKECIGAYEYNFYSPEWGKERELTEFIYSVILKSELQSKPELTEKELKINLQNFWIEPEKALEKLKSSKDFCGFGEVSMLRKFISKKLCSTDDGVLVSSGEFTGLTSAEARIQLIAFAEKNGFGHKKINYKLRDWLFSRQRYWGEPIPLIHLESSDIEKLPKISSLEEVKDEKNAYVLHQTPLPNPLLPGEGTNFKGATNCSFISPAGENGERCLVSTEQNWERCGVEKYLILNGKIFSKIYDGIYGKIVCDYRLPLELPQVEAYEPAGDGQSPLAKVPEFVNVQLAENLSGKRETNTMPQWGGSCWYYLRFMDAKNPEELVSKAAESYWGSVDSYVGGAEHAVLHLLYARFWHKFLYDIGVVSTIEPFHRLRNQGMILAYAYQRANGGLLANDLVEEKDGKFYEISTKEEVKRVVAKMSKSLKNVVNPDDIVKQFGADTLRLYEMYMGDFADTKPWDTTAIVGCRRFLDRVHALYIDGKEKFAQSDEKAMKTLHKAIKKITEDIENYKFNTAIAQMMICINEGLPQDIAKKQEWKESFLKLLHPFAPHLVEECWEKIVLSHTKPHHNSSPQGEDEATNDSKIVASLSSEEREFKSEVFGREKNTGSKFSKIYFATGNIAKIERLQKLVGSDITIEAYSELIDVEETGKTALECALQKLAVYEGKKIDTPILTADTSVHFEGQDFEPTRVRRAALEKAGKKESELSREEIGLLMRDFYQDIARKAGGKIAFHYTDAFAILYPDGSKKSYQYTRPYYLTDTIFGELNPNIPMRSLYISQITGKTAYNTTDEDYEKEFAAQKDMALELFGLGKKSIFFTQWPSYDEALTVDNELTIGVQVLGKLRGDIHVSVDESQDSVLAKAKANPDVAKWLEGKQIVKEIYVPGKIVNIVVK